MHASAQCQSKQDNRSQSVTLLFPLSPADGARSLKILVTRIGRSESGFLMEGLSCHCQRFIWVGKDDTLLCLTCLNLPERSGGRMEGTCRPLPLVEQESLAPSLAPLTAKQVLFCFCHGDKLSASRLEKFGNLWAARSDILI